MLCFLIRALQKRDSKIEAKYRTILTSCKIRGRWAKSPSEFLVRDPGFNINGVLLTGRAAGPYRRL